ncbi:ABC transporter ATP-binding protein [Enterocloster sp.]|uniref:ABC transporter ATP-binding protein n=1 Tax=Enterocloster sp. TaxID=2719315 RepID=UPI003AF05155
MAEPYKNTEPLLKVEHLKKYYPQNRPIFGRPTSWIRAADDVSLELYPGETLGLVGESGCGKSTLGRMIAGLEAPDSGRIWYKGQELTAKGGRGYSAVRTEIQMVFQDSYSSLNPRKQIFQILSEPMLYHSLADKHTVHKKAEHLMELVGLPLSALDRYPYEFSGGQRQRIGIAKALSLEPKLLICDEPVSALDVSIQAQILNLLKSLQKELDLTCIFIGHGLGAVNYVSRRIAVMYLGKLVETGESSELFEHPVHPYTRTLLGAVPIPDPRKREENWGETSEGTAYEPSSTGAEDKGCPFKDRCFRKRPECSSAEVPLRPVRPGSTHLAACSPAVLEVKRSE